eukprot:GILI01008782.1.p1 GENE.GILI01008782.1~~GILI01008782.1.p1  ORF type:complete len:586 (+),score=132.79 GILI01008782.1:74-1831(+)
MTVIAEEKKASSGFAAAVSKWFDPSPSQRFAEELTAPTNFNRYALLLPVFFMQISVGSIYASSIYNQPIATSTGWSLQLNQTVFSIIILFFGFGSAFFGPFMTREGPQRTAFIAITFFIVGREFAGLAIWYQQEWLYFIAGGVFIGIGSGSAYFAALTAIVKWFPDKKGLMSSFSAMAFAIGSLVSTQAETASMKYFASAYSAQAAPAATLCIFGGIYTVLCYPVIALLHFPEEGWKPEGWVPPPYMANPYGSMGLKTVREVLTNKNYWIFYVVFGGSCICGLCFFSSTKSILIKFYGISDKDATDITTAVSACNAIGRLVFGFLSDKIGRKLTFIIINGFQTFFISLLAVAMAADVYALFVASCFVLVICYGGANGLMSAFCADLFGSQNLSTLITIIQTSWSIAAVVGIQIWNNLNATYGGHHYYTFYNFIWLAFICFMLGFVMCFFIEAGPSPVHLPHLHWPHWHMPHMPHWHMPHLFGHHGHGHPPLPGYGPTHREIAVQTVWTSDAECQTEPCKIIYEEELHQSHPPAIRISDASPKASVAVDIKADPSTPPSQALHHNPTLHPMPALQLEKSEIELSSV